MTAIVAALVGIANRRDCLLAMKSNLKDAFARICASICNGCFNSIPTSCRERPIIKRKHRSGMRNSSRFFLCLAKAVLSLYLPRMIGVQLSPAGSITP